MTQRFRKKPVVIEARHFTKWSDLLGANGIATWCGGAPIDAMNGVRHLELRTLEGVMRADVGDWIIRGVAGEFYPCKPEIFAATYEEVEE